MKSKYTTLCPRCWLENEGSGGLCEACELHELNREQGSKFREKWYGRLIGLFCLLSLSYFAGQILRAYLDGKLLP